MIARGCLLAILVGAGIARPALAQDPLKAIARTLEAYEEAWNRHDAHEIARFYYEPAMRVTTGGPVVRTTRQEEEAFFRNFLSGLVKGGYERSVWESLSIRLLDPNTAIASGVTVRYRADGSVFARLGVTYALYSTPEGWRIFLSATHEPASALQFR